MRPSLRNVLACATALALLGLAADAWFCGAPQSLPDQLFARRVDGSPTPLGFDVRVAPAGDVDGDGRADVLLMARHGSPRVLSGADGRELELAGNLLRRPDLREAFGVGDVDGDGRGDLVVSNGTGDVFLWTADGERRLPLEPPAKGRVELHLLNDHDGDGARDFALVRSDLEPRAIELRSPRTDRPLQVVRQPRSFGDRACRWAAVVRSASDVDGDGRIELLVGSPARANAEDGRGRVELLSSRDGSCLAYRLGDRRSGASLCVLDDLDGDGMREIAVATGEHVELCSGATLESMRVFVASASEAGAASPSVLAAGDVDGDGLTELLVTWTVHTGSRPFADGSLAELIDPRDGRRRAALWLPGMSSEDFAVPVGDVDADGAADLAVLRLLRERSVQDSLERLVFGDGPAGVALHVLSGAALVARGGTLDLAAPDVR